MSTQFSMPWNILKDTPDDLNPGRVEFWTRLGHNERRADLIASCSPQYWEYYHKSPSEEAIEEAAAIIMLRVKLLLWDRGHAGNRHYRELPENDPLHWYYRKNKWHRGPSRETMPLWQDGIQRAVQATSKSIVEDTSLLELPGQVPLTHIGSGFMGFLCDSDTYSVWRWFRNDHDARQAATPPRQGTYLPDGAVYISGNYLGRQDAISHFSEPYGPLWGQVLLGNGPDAFSHYCIAGKSQCDRTLVIKILMYSMPYDRWVVYDEDGELCTHIAGTRPEDPIHHFNYLDAGAPAWDIAKDVASPQDAANIARVLIPHQQGRNPDFTAAIRALVAAAMKALHRKAPEKWTFLDLLAALEFDNIETVLSQFDSTRKVYDVHVRRNQGASSYLLSTLAATLEPFKAIAAAWHRAEKKLSIREWLESDDVLILGNDNRHREAIAIINRVLLQLISEGLLRQPPQPDRRTWLFLDGFDKLGTLKRIRTLMSEGNERGVTVVLGFHDIDKLRIHYDGDATKSLLSMCGNLAFLSMENSATAQWASDVIGHQEVFLDQTSRHYVGNEQQPHSVTLAETRIRRPVVPATSFQELPSLGPRGLFGYFKTAIKPPYFGHLDMKQLTRWGLVGDEVARLEDSTEQPDEEFEFPEDTATLLSRLGFPCSSSGESARQQPAPSPAGSLPEQPVDEADDFDPDDFPRFTI